MNWKYIFNNKGFWGPIIGAGISVAGGLLGKKKKEQKPQFEMAPEYPEAAGARKNWWQKLQEWGGAPGYGAISPNWGDIWQRAKKKVSQYWWGGPVSPGMAGKVKASAARRGVAESPAMEELMTRMGMQEAGQLQEMGTEQALQEALYGETGRQNWMQQIMQLAGLKPTTQAYMPEQRPGIGGMIAGLGPAVGQAIGQYEQRNWYEGLIDKILGAARPATT